MIKLKLKDFFVSNGSPFVFIGGPCVIESEEVVFKTASKLKDELKSLDIPFVFKSSYDKANRSSIKSFRGPGIQNGLEILSSVKKELEIPICTDVHSVNEIEKVAKMADIIQIPAFLCRQTDLLLAAGKTDCIVNVKKGQFLAPDDIGYIIEKLESVNCKKIMITERGVSFGYHNLVNDFGGLEIMKRFGYPLVFDTTHSVQMPSSNGGVTGGKRDQIPVLARAAIAAGVAALFMEVHPSPEDGLSDSTNMYPLKNIPGLLRLLKKIDFLIKE